MAYITESVYPPASARQARFCPVEETNRRGEALGTLGFRSAGRAPGPQRATEGKVDAQARCLHRYPPVLICGHPGVGRIHKQPQMNTDQHRQAA